MGWRNAGKGVTMLNMFAERKQLVNRDVREITGDGPPVNAVTGAGDAGPASTYTDYTNGRRYFNAGTKSSPVWVPAVATATGTISAADIVRATAGGLGHAQGYTLLAAQGLHVVVELISVILNYDFAVAAYTAGGNLTINWTGGGAALTGLVSAANSLGAAADKSVMFLPLAAAATALVENAGLSLVSSVAFTQPGTAAGVVRYVVNYRIHNTGF